MAAAEASLEQLATRAGAARQNPSHAAWPEFSEYDCYACHHDLRSAAAARRTAKSTGRRQAGVLTVSRWNVMMTRQWAALSEQHAATRAFLDALDQLRGDMQRYVAPKSEGVEQAAHTALDRLRQWMAVAATSAGLDVRLESHRASHPRPSFAKVPVRCVLETFSLDDDDGASLDWDTAAQIYLAAVALNIGEMDRNRFGMGMDTTGPVSIHPGSLSASERARWLILRDLRRQLAFPQGQQSPSSQWGDAPQERDRFPNQLQNFLRLLDQHENPHGA